MLFLSHRQNGLINLPDINAQGINEFYFSHVDFDKTCADAKRLVCVMDKAVEMLGDKKRPSIKAHEAIHLILLMDSIWDDYTRAWEAKLPDALDRFNEAFASAKATKDDQMPDQFWIRYGQWTRVNSDRGERITHRHIFYIEKMHEFMAPLQDSRPKARIWRTRARVNIL